MLRFLILLSPVYVSVFWLISLLSNKKNISIPARFLSFFMLIGAICFFGQYLFFAPYPSIFPYWEPFLAYFGSIAFPVYYIYFRLLTVDDSFSLKKHFKYLAVPLLIATVYTVGILLTPFAQYKAWLYNDSLYPHSAPIQFLGVMRKVVKLTFVVLLVITYILNRGLLKKYAHKAEQYYSDYQDGRYNHARILNYFLIIISASSFVAHLIGRKLLLPSEVTQDIIWLIFAVSLYGIGFWGFKQKPVNPTFEPDVEVEETEIINSELNLSQRLILEKILETFQTEKLYLNSNLNIIDVVQAVGTNRTYISAIINQQYNQNFCSFVNSFRLEELERIFIGQPSLSNQLLAEQSGFGSFNSMKRAISAQSGYSLSEWKETVLEKNGVCVG